MFMIGMFLKEVIQFFKRFFQEFGRVGGIMIIVGFIILAAQLIYQILVKEWFMIILDSLAISTLLFVVIYKMTHST